MTLGCKGLGDLGRNYLWLRLRFNDSGVDHGQYEREHSALFRGDDVIEAGHDERSQDCGHVGVRKGTQDFDRFFDRSLRKIARPSPDIYYYQSVTSQTSVRP